jgi:hypothetical protein
VLQTTMPSQCALIISHEFLNALGCEFVCMVKAIPRKVQIQISVRDWFQALALGIDRFVHEILVRHRKARYCPLQEDVVRHGYQLST